MGNLKRLIIILYSNNIFYGGRSSRTDYGVGSEAFRRRFESRPRAAPLSGQATV